MSHVKSTIGLKEILALVHLRILPHLLLLRRLPCRLDVEADLAMWLRHDKTERCRTGHFTHVIARSPEFRNLFYYRASSDRTIVSRALLFLSRLFFLPLQTLVLNVRSIGPGFFIQHGFSTVIYAESIGRNVWVNQCVTIGHLGVDGCPVIGNNVMITVGARVLGGITIGDNVRIGANAVVLKNVPQNCTVVGVPAYIVKRDGLAVREDL
jgi:serine O-acetyltransferase